MVFDHREYRGWLGLATAIMLVWVGAGACTAHDRPAGMTPPVMAEEIDLPAADRQPSADRQPDDHTGSRAETPLLLSVSEAVMQSLENNRALVVERLTPEINRTIAEQEQAVFDPVLSADISIGRERGERQARSGSDTERSTVDTLDGSIALEQYFPTGTTVALDADTEMDDSSLYDDRFHTTRLGLTLTQALLRGYGSDVNRVRLDQARLDTKMSEYELRGYTETLVAEVEKTYWDYALAVREIEIVEESLKVARQQLDETRELIAVGRLPRAEQAAEQAEVASQEQALIEARSKMASLRLKLLQLINPPGSNAWDRDIVLRHQPRLPDAPLEAVESHVALARRMRPVLNQARLQKRRGDLELIRTRNGILPLVDFFITLGKSGYANTFGDSMGHLSKDSYDALAGIRFEYPLANRAAAARHRQALISRRQAGAALENLTHLVELDVRTAHIEVKRARQQITATSATREFDEVKWRTETEKLRVGKSTGFLVAQAQRDLLASRIEEVHALVSYLKALTDLYRLDGSLLERRGIDAPGREPAGG